MERERAHGLLRALDRCTDAGFWLAGAALLFTVGAVTVDVFMRYSLNYPLNWLTEIIETLMLYVTFLGGAWVARAGGHVTVDILLTHLPTGMRRKTLVAANLTACLVCGVLVVFGTRVTVDYFVRDVHSITVLELPMAPKLLVIPLGSLLMSLQFLRKAAGQLLGEDATKAS